MGKVTYRKCPECDHLNLNSDYCEQCGALININLKRRLEHEKRVHEKEKERKLKNPNTISLYFKKMRKHPNLFIRMLAKALYSVWLVVMAIGAFIAFIFSYFTF